MAKIMLAPKTRVLVLRLVTKAFDERMSVEDLYKELHLLNQLIPLNAEG